MSGEDAMKNPDMFNKGEATVPTTKTTPGATRRAPTTWKSSSAPSPLDLAEAMKEKEL